MKVQVIPGEIRLSTIIERPVGPDAFYPEIDCSTKYCQPDAQISDDGVVVYLSANEQTLRIDETKRGTPTIIDISGIGAENLSCFADWGRYTVYVAIIRRGDGRVIWRN